MSNMKTIHINKTSTYAFLVAAISVVGFAVLFSAVEPKVTHSQEDTSEFIIRQTITAESSFLVEPADVTMAGSINGVTGGQATGTTQFAVQTNNANGYRVTVSFADDDADGEAMLGDSVGGGEIRDYQGDVLGEPSRGYTPSTAAQLAYTVTSSSTFDTAQSFFHDGTNCNAGISQTAVCWKAPEVGEFEIVRRDSAAVTGATSTIQFNVTVPSGATPTPQAQTYTATATLSLYNL